MNQPQEKLVEHLLRKSLLFKNKCSASYRIIQSRLTNQSLEVASQSELSINFTKQKNLLKVCQWCSCYWSEGMYSFKIEPQKRTSKFMRSLLNRDVGILTEMQVKRRNKCTSRCNRMVVTCHVCKKETKVPLQKPDLITNKLQSSEQTTLPLKSKKKKKKKDSYAGLKSEAVLKCKITGTENQSTIPGPEHKQSNNASNIVTTSTINSNLSTTSNNTNSVFSIQNRHLKKKKKNKMNIGKLKHTLAKEMKSNVPTISSTETKKKSNNSLLSAFLTSL
ncbi:uncharacterized protein LOC111048099 [Nilaparvata lugens]|uniref:uncharacterized protein LOC111048099 n=1 Tax=Nilaparvata lugens TaxID=108931 RepID=UPI00193DEF07|nr:uncharacterized protein LOC111048099 [Nilaparvata lugens]